MVPDIRSPSFAGSVRKTPKPNPVFFTSSPWFNVNLRLSAPKSFGDSPSDGPAESGCSCTYVYHPSPSAAGALGLVAHRRAPVRTPVQNTAHTALGRIRGSRSDRGRRRSDIPRSASRVSRVCVRNCSPAIFYRLLANRHLVRVEEAGRRTSERASTALSAVCLIYCACALGFRCTWAIMVAWVVPGARSQPLSGNQALSGPTE